MNAVRISGVLQAVVERTSHSGTFLTASLNFDREGHTILLIAAGSRVRQLQPFDSGDFICAIGRLTFFKGQYAVLVDEASPWAVAAHSRKRFFYDEVQTQKIVSELEA